MKKLILGASLFIYVSGQIDPTESIVSDYFLTCSSFFCAWQVLNVQVVPLEIKNCTNMFNDVSEEEKALYKKEERIMWDNLTSPVQKLQKLENAVKAYFARKVSASRQLLDRKLSVNSRLPDQGSGLHCLRRVHPHGRQQIQLCKSQGPSGQWTPIQRDGG